MSEKAREIKSEDVERFAAIAKAAGPAQVEAILAKTKEIAELDFAAIDKISRVGKAVAANNGICGLGC